MLFIMMSSLKWTESRAIAGKGHLFEHMVAVITVISLWDCTFFSLISFGNGSSVLVLFQFKPIISQSLSHCPRCESHVYAGFSHQF